MRKQNGKVWTNQFLITQNITPYISTKIAVNVIFLKNNKKNVVTLYFYFF